MRISRIPLPCKLLVQGCLGPLVSILLNRYDLCTDDAGNRCSTWFLINTTQACVAATRCFVQESIAEKFITALKERFNSAKGTIGSPLEPTVMVGPLVDKAQFERVMKYIDFGKQEGDLAVGGTRIGEKGYFVEPTIFLNPKTDGKIWKEEIFGPVLSIRTFKTEDEVVNWANDTEYGLSGMSYSSVMTRPFMWACGCDN
jgi:aldehyde dehydrogenase (NAD+)